MIWSHADRLRFDRIIKTLEKNFSIEMGSSYTPFEVLISTILSQNTNRDNTTKAFERLKEQFKITPQELASADLEEIKRCIKPAGLYNAKARRIRKVARIIWEQYDGDLSKILNLPTSEARNMLLSLPGVGRKTADVVLSFCTNKGTFPVDTHINRIAKRLRWVEEKAGYEEIRHFFEDMVSEKQRKKVHLVLIEFGRKVCRAKNPHCKTCPIREDCQNENICQ